VPGTTPAGFQNAITDTPARALTTNVNGTARNNNNTRLDGATNIYIWLPHHAVYVAPADTVDTVSMTTASFDAEQGMAGGASVTVLTKSGTNEFHGSGSWLHEDDSLRARLGQLGRQSPTQRNIGSVTAGRSHPQDKCSSSGPGRGARPREHEDGDPPDRVAPVTSARSAPRLPGHRQPRTAYPFRTT
jgi:hypothetical protein